jgi:8-oxo-dGTP pyrophosphatase MutT (NUDIX family)
VRDVSIIFLVRREKGEVSEVLLAMKKRGFGEGLWNGYGGKFDQEKDKNLVNSAIRECKEESGLEISDLKKVAEIEFTHQSMDNFQQRAHVYLVEEWKGEPEETEEMKPKWFNVKDVPYGKMWVDDAIWLPKLLSGETLKAHFVFGKDDEILEQSIQSASFK